MIVTENDKRWLILRAKISERNIQSAFRSFRAHGIEPILIKGWAAAREYPENYQRSYSDIDLAVPPAAFEKSLQLLETGEIRQLNIDLHSGLRHLDTVEWDDLFENSRTHPIEDVPVRVLRPEDHLRVLCVHWLTDGGAYKDRLLDIYYLLKNNEGSFDWERCLLAVGANRRDWILKTLAVVVEQYGLEQSLIPQTVELPRLPAWFRKALEREWSDETKLKDIQSVTRDRRELWKQIKKRLRPNAIQATVFMDGKFDDSARMYYQIGSFWLRLKPSWQRFLAKYKKKNSKIASDND